MFQSYLYLALRRFIASIEPVKAHQLLRQRSPEIARNYAISRRNFFAPVSSDSLCATFSFVPAILITMFNVVRKNYCLRPMSGVFYCFYYYLPSSLQLFIHSFISQPSSSLLFFHFILFRIRRNHDRERHLISFSLRLRIARFYIYELNFLSVLPRMVKIYATTRLSRAEI